MSESTSSKNTPPRRGPAGKRTRRAVLAKIGAPLLIIAGVVAVAAIAQFVPIKDRSAAAKPREPEDVKAVLVRAQEDFPDRFTLSAVVEPERVVEVSAEVAGRVVGIPCEEGAACRAGDVLIELDKELLRADVEQLQAQKNLNEAQLRQAEAQNTFNEAEVRRATAQKEFDQKEYKRQQALEARNVATRTEVDQAATAIKASTAALDAAVARAEAATEAIAAARAAIASNEAALQAAGTRLAHATIKAPISGVLNRVPVEEGSYVAPGMPVAQIVDLVTAKVVVDVPELDIAYLKLGDEAKVFPDLGRRSERYVTGRITYVGRLADPGTRTTRIEISVKNRDVDGEGNLRVHEAKVTEVRDNIALIAASVPAESAQFFGERANVEVLLGEARPQVLTGTVRRSTSAGDAAATAARRAEITVPNGQRGLTTGRAVRIRARHEMLTSGQIVRVRLTRDILPSAILVPLKAIIPGEDESKRSVYVVESGKARRVDGIELGLLRGQSVQVRKGLAEGDVLIIEGQQYVGPGDPVNITNPEALEAGRAPEPAEEPVKSLSPPDVRPTD